MSRAAGAAVAALGVLLAVAPALTWYSAEVAGRRVTASGFEGAGELWTLPPLGALALVAGAVLARPPGGGSPPLRGAGAVALAAGVLALAWSARAALDPAVVLTLLDDGERVRVDAPAAVEPAAAAAPAAAVALAALGGGLILLGRRR